jgi:tetratricopeptide (TPR) repeat protein
MVIGRDEQLREINEHVQGHMEGGGGPNVLFVTGEAGIGKTTLLQAFMQERRMHTKEIVIASAACSTPLAGQDIGEVEALLPWAEIMTALSAEGQERKLETRRLVTELAMAWIRVIPVVGDVLESVADTAHIVRGHNARSGREHAPPVNAASQQQLFQQYINVLTKLSERAPLVLVLDDFHWADSSSANLLFTAARQLEAHPIVFIVAYRPDDAVSSRAGEGHPILHIRNELERYSLAVEIGVPQLTASDLDSLLRRRYPSYQDNDAFEEWLAKVSAGNALFITQYLETLEDDGYIDSREGTIRAGYEEATVPQSAYAVVSERVRRLSEETRELLRYASVEGDTFTTSVLAKITEMPQLKLLQRLRLAEQVHHVVHSLGKQRIYTSETTAYQFSHALLHMAMYDSLEQEERELLHQAIFDVLKEEWNAALVSRAGNLSSIAARLAVHAGVLGEHLFAADVLIDGAEASWRTYAEQETLRDLEKVFQSLDDAEEHGGDRKESNRLRAEAIMLRGEIHSLRGRYDAALDDFRHAHALFSECADQVQMVEAMNYEAVILGRQGNIAESERHAEDALAQARTIGDMRVQALALRTLGVLRYRSGIYEEALEYYSDSLAIEQSRGNRQGEADMLVNIASVHYQRRRYDEALEQYRYALELYENLDHRTGAARQLNNIGLVLDLRGERDEALSNFQRSLATFRSIGDRTNEAMVLNNIGNLLSRAGEDNEAMEHFGLSLRIYQEIGERSGEATALYNSGNILRHRGEHEGALDMMRRSRELFTAIGNSKGEVTALGDIGEVLLALGRPAEALEALRQMLETSEQRKFVQQQAQALLLLGRCHIALSELQPAREYLERAIAQAGEHGLSDVESQVREVQGVIEEMAAQSANSN